EVVDDLAVPRGGGTAGDRGARGGDRHPGDRLPGALRRGGGVDAEVRVTDRVRDHEPVTRGGLGDPAGALDRVPGGVDQHGGVLDAFHPRGAIPVAPVRDGGQFPEGDAGEPVEQVVLAELGGGRERVRGEAVAGGAGREVGDELAAEDVDVRRVLAHALDVDQGRVVAQVQRGGRPVAAEEVEGDDVAVDVRA